MHKPAREEASDRQHAHAHADPFQNIIALNEVPNSLLEDFARWVQCETSTVPEDARQPVLRRTREAIASGDKAARFYVLITAINHCPEVRAALTTPLNEAHLKKWLTESVERAWTDFFTGVDESGVSACKNVDHSKHKNVLGFCALLQAEYMKMGWKS